MSPGGPESRAQARIFDSVGRISYPPCNLVHLHMHFSLELSLASQRKLTTIALEEAVPKVSHIDPMPRGEEELPFPFSEGNLICLEVLPAAELPTQSLASFNWEWGQCTTHSAVHPNAQLLLPSCLLSCECPQLCAGLCSQFCTIRAHSA